MQKNKKNIILLLLILIASVITYEIVDNNKNIKTISTEQAKNIYPKTSKKYIFLDKPDCKYCQNVKKELKDKLDEFEIINYKSEEAKKIIKAYDIKHVPTVIIIKENKMITDSKTIIKYFK